MTTVAGYVQFDQSVPGIIVRQWELPVDVRRFELIADARSPSKYTAQDQAAFDAATAALQRYAERLDRNDGLGDMGKLWCYDVKGSNGR